MDLHDAAEDLPNQWESLLDIALITYQADRDLHEMRQRLALLESKGGEGK